MKAFHVKTGKLFRYIGPGDGYGIIHMVTSVSADEATTWSMSFRPDGTWKHMGGDTWMGPPEAFAKHFVPLELQP